MTVDALLSFILSLADAREQPIGDRHARGRGGCRGRPSGSCPPRPPATRPNSNASPAGCPCGRGSPSPACCSRLRCSRCSRPASGTTTTRRWRWPGRSSSSGRSSCSTASLAAIRLFEVLLIDYVPFLILLWGLYTVSGGIYAAGDAGRHARAQCLVPRGGPRAGVADGHHRRLDAPRPSDAARQRTGGSTRPTSSCSSSSSSSNLGGLLTPLGDPPLFLGFIHGVPFFWTLRLLPEYLFVVGHCPGGVRGHRHAPDAPGDSSCRPTHEPPHRRTSFQVEGAHNFLLLFGILGAVLLSGLWHTPGALVVRHPLRVPRTSCATC